MPDVLAGYNGADGIPEGATPTAANSAGDSGTAVGTISVGGGTIIATSASAKNGARGFQFVLPANTGGAQRLIWGASSAVGTRRVYGFWLRISTTISSVEDIFHSRISAGNGVVLTFTAAGYMAWNGIAASVGTVAFPTNSWQWVQIAIAPNTTTTTGTLSWGWGPSATSLTDSWTSTATNAGTSALTGLAIGRTTTRVVGNTMDFDSLRWGDLTTGFLTTPQTDPAGAAAMTSASALTAAGAASRVAAVTMTSGSNLTGDGRVKNFVGDLRYDWNDGTVQGWANGMGASVASTGTQLRMTAYMILMGAGHLFSTWDQGTLRGGFLAGDDTLATVLTLSSSGVGPNGPWVADLRYRAADNSTWVAPTQVWYRRVSDRTWVSGLETDAAVQVICWFSAGIPTSITALGTYVSNPSVSPSGMLTIDQDNFRQGTFVEALTTSTTMQSGSNLTAAATVTAATAAGLTSASNLVADATLVRPGAAVMSSTSGMTVGGDRTTPAAVTMTSTSTLSSSTTRIQPGADTMSSASGLAADATVLSGSTATMTSASTLTAAATLTAGAAALLGSVSNLVTTGSVVSPIPTAVTMQSASGMTVGGTYATTASVLMISASDLCGPAGFGDTMGDGFGAKVDTVQTRAALVMMTSTSTLTAAGTRVRDVGVTMNSTSSLTVNGVRRRPADATLTSASSLTVGTTLKRSATVTLSSHSMLVADVTLTTTGHDITIRVDVSLRRVTGRATIRTVGVDADWNQHIKARATINEGAG